MTGRPDGPVVAVGLLIAASAFFSSNILIGRAAAEAVPPIDLAFWRWTAASAIMLPFSLAAVRRHWASIRAGWPRLLLLGSIGMGVCGLFVYVGLQRTTATNAALLYQSSPVLMLILSAGFAIERVRPTQWLGVAVALAGVFVILTRGEPSALLDFRFETGDLWVMGSAGGWAVYSMLLPRFAPRLPTIVLFQACAVAGAVCLMPLEVGAIALGASADWSLRAAASVLGLAIFSSILAYTCFQRGLAVLGPARAGPFMYLMPVWTAMIAWAFLGESFEYFHAVGLALILPGVGLASAITRPTTVAGTRSRSSRSGDH